MRAVYPHKVDIVNPTICGLQEKKRAASVRAMTADAPYIEIGQRLEAVRQHFSTLSQRDWAKKHGFNPTQYNNWAKGTRRITVDAAEVLCDRYHLTLDAIYRGNLSGLSENLINIL